MAEVLSLLGFGNNLIPKRSLQGECNQGLLYEEPNDRDRSHAKYNSLGDSDVPCTLQFLPPRNAPIETINNQEAETR
jgi:hypothetical protein